MNKKKREANSWAFFRCLIWVRACESMISVVGVLSFREGRFLGFSNLSVCVFDKMRNERERWELVLGIRVCLFAWGRVRVSVRRWVARPPLAYRHKQRHSARGSNISFPYPSILSIYFSPPPNFLKYH
jgi:hypothetical protein